MRDSNPRSRDQNPLPYRLANPHRTSYYNGRLVSVKLEIPPTPHTSAGHLAW